MIAHLDIIMLLLYCKGVKVCGYYMLEEKSLKFKIVVSMVALSLITTLFTSFIDVLKTRDVINDGAKQSFALSAKDVANQIYAQLSGVEDNVQLMADLVSKSTSIQNQSDMSKLKASIESEYARVRLYPKTIAEHTKWAQGSYFYFDQKYAPAYDGAWYFKNGSNFKRQMLNSPISDEGANAWYFVPIHEKKSIWSNPYTDADLKIPMITYSMPVYKNNFLLGLSGVDITLSELNKMLDNIQIYKGTEAFMIDSKSDFIAGHGFNVGDNILTSKNVRYQFLKNEFKKSPDGVVQYRYNMAEQVLSYTTLPNGFILIIEVPLRNIPTKMAGTVLVLMLLSLIIAIVTCIGALKIGDLLSKPINDVVSKLSDYAHEVANGADKFLSLSQKLAEGSAEQAASVQETSSTLEESASMLSQNNENTKQAVYLANNTEEVANKGNLEMNSVVASIKELNQSSYQINTITEVISKIAFQTNILSLNAAVEAARAGDSGKGFAVVAEEVRELAKRSAEASRDIAIIIKNNIDLSQTCVQLTEKASVSLSEINLQAKKVKELLDEIAISSNEQAVGISQITTAMNQIEQVVQGNASHAESIAGASEELLNNVQSGIDSIQRIVNGS